MSTNVSNRKFRLPKTEILFAALLPFFFWDLATPWVSIQFSNEGQGSLDFVISTQDEIYRREIKPGGVTGRHGHIFPDDDFFMQIDWSYAGQNHCFSVNPKWPSTHIYIGPDGTVDRRPGSDTDLESLTPCLREG